MKAILLAVLIFWNWTQRCCLASVMAAHTEFRIAKEDDQLVLRWQESNGGTAPKDWNDKYSRVMVAQLEEFEVLTREDYRKDWIENRRVDTSKPFLVMLKVKAAGRNWPDLIVRVKH